MVSEGESITEDEIEEEILGEGSDEGFTIDAKKERVQEINHEIKKLLSERDDLEKEIEEMYDDLENED
jgi:polyribonucleotide nucleotidyltransferase